jgi:TPR repeat protein
MGNLASNPEKDYTKGLNHYKSKRYAQALKCLIKNANKEHCKTLNLLGKMHQHGYGVLPDGQKALEYYTMSLELEDSEAQYILGIWSFRGMYVPLNDQKAVVLLIKSALQEHAKAQYQLGDMYEKGDGVLQDIRKAIKWFTMGSEHCDNARHHLGDMYYYGRGVPREYMKAFSLYYDMKSKYSHVDVLYNMGHMYEHGLGVQQNISKAKDMYLSVYCGNYRANINGNDSIKSIRLEIEHELGRLNECDVKKDQIKAMEWYRKAAEQGHAKSQYSLAKMYNIEDSVKSFEWLLKSANLGYDQAQYDIGMHYYHGKYVDQDLHKALEWFQLSASSQHIKGANMYSVTLLEIERSKSKKHSDNVDKIETLFKQEAITSCMESQMYDKNICRLVLEY